MSEGASPRNPETKPAASLEEMQAVAASIPAPDMVLNKAREFTNEEVTCLSAWLAAYLAGDKVAAEAILETGLLAEHYRSLLVGDGENPGTFNTAQADVLNGLREAAKKARDVGGYGV